jgi:hypothetical protein
MRERMGNIQESSAAQPTGGAKEGGEFPLDRSSVQPHEHTACCEHESVENETEEKVGRFIVTEPSESLSV